jgi:cell division protein FtsL
MNKLTWRDFLFILMIVVVIALSIYIIIFMKTQSYQCISNSAKYTIQNIEKASSGNVSCSCIVSGQQPIRFTMDDSGVNYQPLK